MKNSRHFIALLIALVLSLSMVAGIASAEKITVIATEDPHAQVLELVKDDLAAKGWELDITVVSDYVVENPATSAGDVMANFFQHRPYLAGYNAEAVEKDQLVEVIGTHFEPMAIYAGTKANLADLAESDKIAVPNDPVNETRALLLLQDAGLIKLPEGTDLNSTVTALDIAENPNNLEIVELNAELIPGYRDDVAFAVINGNYAKQVQLVPYTDGLFAEQPDSLAAEAYVNIVVVRPENAETEWVKALEEVIYTQKVYDLIVNAGFAPTFTPAN